MPEPKGKKERKKAVKVKKAAAGTPKIKKIIPVATACKKAERTRDEKIVEVDLVSLLVNCSESCRFIGKIFLKVSIIFGALGRTKINIKMNKNKFKATVKV